MGCGTSAPVEETPDRRPAGKSDAGGRSASYYTEGDLADFAARSVGRLTDEPTTFSLFLREKKHVVAARVSHGINADIDQFEAFPESRKEVASSVARCAAWMKAQEARNIFNDDGNSPKTKRALSLVAFDDSLLLLPPLDGYATTRDGDYAADSQRHNVINPNSKMNVSATATPVQTPLHLGAGAEDALFGTSPLHVPHNHQQQHQQLPHFPFPSPLGATGAAHPPYSASGSQTSHFVFSIGDSTTGTTTEQSEDSSHTTTTNSVQPQTALGFFHEEDTFMPTYIGVRSSNQNSSDGSSHASTMSAPPLQYHPLLREGVPLVVLPYNYELNEELLRAHTRLVQTLRSGDYRPARRTSAAL